VTGPGTITTGLSRTCPEFMHPSDTGCTVPVTRVAKLGMSDLWENISVFGLEDCLFLGDSKFNFKVCKSVHHCTIQINHQPNATILCFLVRAFSYILISRPTDVTCERFLFSIYMCITLHISSVKRSSSGVPHRTYSLQFLCLCLSAALSWKKLFSRQCRRRTQTQKLEAVCTVRDS
jgi:hypothetical protein